MSVGSTHLQQAVQISATDRFGFTLFLSLVLNAVVILGIGFSPEDKGRQDMLPTLDITLVPTVSEEAPDEADFLAQNDQIGGGEAEDRIAPTTPSPATVSTSDASGSPFMLQPMEATPKPRDQNRDLMTASISDLKFSSEPRETPEMPEVKIPLAAELIARSQEIARLSADLSEDLQAFAKKPRHKYLSAASARSYKYASYIAEWKRKVEDVGDQNFPDEARRRRLGGDLLLDVAIYPNGTIAEISLRRSSGHKVLDDAAINIVRLAAPFAQFSPDIRKELDIMHITRTWQFLPEGSLVTR